MKRFAFAIAGLSLAASGAVAQTVIETEPAPRTRTIIEQPAVPVERPPVVIEQPRGTVIEERRSST